MQMTTYSISSTDAGSAVCTVVPVACHYYALLEVQVPLSRGTTALQWLQGQKAAHAHHLLQPQVYFSPRKSSAPGTPGAAAAEAASAGAGAVAGTVSQQSIAALHCIPAVAPLAMYTLLAANDV